MGSLEYVSILDYKDKAMNGGTARTLIVKDTHFLTKGSSIKANLLSAP